MNNKSLILNLYNQSISYLDLTFLDSNLIDLVKTKDEFKQIVTNLLTFVIDCEDNRLVEQNNQQRLLAAFNAITSSEFSPNTQMTFKSDEELDAEVKSFDTYLIKNLDKNFEQIKSEFKLKHTEEPVKVESEVVGIVGANETSHNDNNHNEHTEEHKEFNAEEFINNNRSNINDMAESMITSAANSMLIMNIRKGTVYQYKTKPKVIPILKWCIIGVVGALIALAIASFAILMVAGPKITWKKDPNEAAINGMQLTSSFPFQLILTILIMSLMISSMIKNNKNENFKYFMSWGWMLIYTFTLIFVWFLDGGLGSNLIFSSIDSFIDKLHIQVGVLQTDEGLRLINIYKILQFVVISFLGLVVILLIVGCVFNPKKDIERLQKLLQQYVDDIKSGTMPFEGGMGGFGGFMGNLF